MHIELCIDQSSHSETDLAKLLFKPVAEVMQLQAIAASLEPTGEDEVKEKKKWKKTMENLLGLACV